MLQAMSAYVRHAFEEDDAECFLKVFSGIDDEITRIYGDAMKIHDKRAASQFPENLTVTS
jgi:hypothetical protein